MDHLVLPEDVKPWIVVAYDGKEDEYYENQHVEGFYNYPQRLGWSEDEVFATPKRIDGELLGGLPAVMYAGMHAAKRAGMPRRPVALHHSADDGERLRARPDRFDARSSQQVT